MPSVANQSKKSRVNKITTGLYTYLADGTSFRSDKAFDWRQIYFPLCGTDANSIKSSITPHLSGDIKLDKDRYLTKPVSVEDLRQDARNFFCYVQGGDIISLASNEEGKAVIEAGMLWHTLKRTNERTGLEMEALNFVPISDEHVELMRITVRNISKKQIVITPTFCLPLFARALANKHDHEHVTSLLNRIEQLPDGVCVEPTMIFNERGHRPCESVYYVLGVDGKGQAPAGTFPTAECFYGGKGSISAPEAVISNTHPTVLSQEALTGKEAVGALRFADVTLDPNASWEYLIVMGINSDRRAMAETFGHFNSSEKFEAALARNKTYWSEKARSIEFSTGNESFDAWMRWVSLQPVLRRIFGCSFLPEHDYGKGGKGWRDIWQDLLSLILIEPAQIRQTLIDSFAGVRIDGSNATIVGSQPGEFTGDRNAIARVWMDHGAWPLLTLLLYIHQTGDYDILLEENTYFRDMQLSRTFEKDYSWTENEGSQLIDQKEQIYNGSIIEHLLIQHLTQFFNVGEHNIIRLEDADWNDGLDMARDRGESVAFTSLYGGNLIALADLLEGFAATKEGQDIFLAKEVKILLDSLSAKEMNYDDAKAKRKCLFETYFPAVQPRISGEREKVSVAKIAGDLRRKGKWIFDHIRKNECVTVKFEGQKRTWFNGYYDNKGNRVEGIKGKNVRMTLIGQVFPIMSGLATESEVEQTVQAVNTFLRDEQFGGLRLNTNFHIPHYLDLGRAFGFAYGTKENGAFFNHMSIMYACALYKRGFVQEGHNVLKSIYQMCVDTNRSKIYPGVPEYFDTQGRGHYHYLTGSASWLVVMQLTQVFGIRGETGDLLLDPKLVKEEFDSQSNTATATSRFAARKVAVTYENPQRLDYGAYKIVEVFVNGDPVTIDKGSNNAVKLNRATIEDTPSECTIKVVLGAK